LKKHQICPDLNRDADEVEMPDRHRPKVPEEETSDHRGDGAADHATKVKNDCSLTLKKKFKMRIAFIEK
jgi:hypothetical protein